MKKVRGTTHRMNKILHYIRGDDRIKEKADLKWSVRFSRDFATACCELGCSSAIMSQPELIFSDVFQRTPENFDKESNKSYGLIKFEKPIEIHSAWVSEIKTKDQPR